MSLRTLPDPALRSLALKYFLAGFLCLPWLWLVNWIYIYPETRRRSSVDPSIRRLVWASLTGAVVMLGVVIAWISVYLTKRRDWGLIGDQLAVSVPLGT
ncbi:gamma-secretase aspartyl protease complex, presenilin enhancer-2 subunit [Phlyctochytrium arcticum]|nr:gamma-secretase aspartyl protease complex, presenilin enhancer-2 subunit [Phlyctochytrium arcticum]